MLHGNELVTLLTRLNEGHVQTDFQFLGNHVISFNALRRLKILGWVDLLDCNCFMPHSCRLFVRFMPQARSHTEVGVPPDWLHLALGRPL